MSKMIQNKNNNTVIASFKVGEGVMHTTVRYLVGNFTFDEYDSVKGIVAEHYKQFFGTDSFSAELLPQYYIFEQRTKLLIKCKSL